MYFYLSGINLLSVTKNKLENHCFKFKPYSYKQSTSQKVMMENRKYFKITDNESVTFHNKL